MNKYQVLRCDHLSDDLGEPIETDLTLYHAQRLTRRYNSQLSPDSAERTFYHFREMD